MIFFSDGLVTCLLVHKIIARISPSLKADDPALRCLPLTPCPAGDCL